MTAKTGLRNPYIAGRALSQDRGFFGREDILRLVETTLQKLDQNALVLFGQRRIGKTSILLQLQRRLPAPPFLPVYFDLMDRARRPLGQVLFEIASTIAAEADMPPVESDQFDDQGIHFRRSFLPALYQALGEDRIPVLLLDEFDVLDITEEQLAPTAAAQAFFPYLRELLAGEPRLRFVFVVGRRAEDLSINVKATFKASLYQRVSVLDQPSARDLITTAERQGALVFEAPAIDRILALTTAHPYFVQLLCQIVWDSAHATDAAHVPRIDVAAVEVAAAKALEAGQNIFEWIWDGLPPAERVISAAIAGATDEQSVVSEEQITQLLQSQGIRILTRELELAPETLVQWEMLRRIEGGYRFFSELMRRWVAERKPLPRVKDELDRIVPLAESLYRSAEAFYRQRDTENAADQLRKALRANANHQKARLLLGQILVEQGQLSEAIREIEEAYHRDEDAARYPLIRALLLYAEERERAGALDEALALYERTLSLSPHEAIAQTRQASIWLGRGDTALRAGRLEQALTAYRQAGAQERAAEVEELLRQRAGRRTPAYQRSWLIVGALALVAAIVGLLVRSSLLANVSPGSASTAVPTVTDQAITAPEPTTAEGFLARGLERLQGKDYDSAIADFNQAIALRPDYPEAYYNIGQAHAGKSGLGQGQQDELNLAINAYSKAISLKSDFAIAYRGRGDAYAATGNNSQAFDDFDQAITLAPDDADNYYSRGNLFIDTDDFARAIADLTQAVKLRPDFTRAYFERGNAHAFSGDFEVAIPDFDKAIELDPNFARAYSRRCRAFYRVDDFEHAIADCDQAIKLNPTDSEPISYRADVYRKQQKYDQAIADYSQTITLRPDLDRAYFGRGLCYAQQGAKDLAIADFRQVLAISKDADMRKDAEQQIQDLGGG